MEILLICISVFSLMVSIMVSCRMVDREGNDSDHEALTERCRDIETFIDELTRKNSNKIDDFIKDQNESSYRNYERLAQAEESIIKISKKVDAAIQDGDRQLDYMNNRFAEIKNKLEKMESKI